MVSIADSIAAYSGFYSSFGQKPLTDYVGLPPAAIDLASDALIAGFGPSKDDTNTKGSILDDALLLNLSPAAQQVLYGMGYRAGLGDYGVPGDGAASFLGYSAPANTRYGASSFLLSAQQQKNITSIVDKYKDSPYTQDSFNLLMGELTAAGLSPRQLAIEDRVQSFGSVSILLGALSHDDTAQLISGSSNQQAKMDGYVEKIINQWRSVSTAYKQGDADPVALN